MPKGYTSRAKIENFLLITIDESFHAQTDDVIDDVEQLIDTYTGRNFIADEEASERLYNGNNSNELEIDDCIEVETVELGNDDYGTSFTELAESAYVTLPANAIAKGFPVKAIHLKTETFEKGIQNQRITAKWGYSEECPGDVSMAATILAAHIWKFGRGGITGSISQEKIGNYSVTYDSDKDKQDYDRAMAILDKYKRYYL
jgi:hypothetical protein